MKVNGGNYGTVLHCSFCGKSQDEVRKLIAGPTVYICDECIELCNEIIAEEAERDEVFRRLARVDHVMIPGGDPGDLEPALLFEWSARVAQILRRHHPHAKIWISPQVFKPGLRWMGEFHAEVAREVLQAIKRNRWRCRAGRPSARTATRCTQARSARRSLPCRPRVS